MCRGALCFYWPEHNACCRPVRKLSQPPFSRCCHLPKPCIPQSTAPASRVTPHCYLNNPPRPTNLHDRTPPTCTTAPCASTRPAPPLPQDLIARLEGQGFSAAVAAWAAMNLVPFNGDSSKLVWGFDLDGISQMYRCVRVGSGRRFKPVCVCGWSCVR